MPCASHSDVMLNPWPHIQLIATLSASAQKGPRFSQQEFYLEHEKTVGD